MGLATHQTENCGRCGVGSDGGAHGGVGTILGVLAVGGGLCMVKGGA